MRPLKLTILTFGLLAFVSAYGGIDDGLVAYYPFNGNADDESGNGNNGVVNGATITQDRFGSVNSAFEFDGTNDYIEVAADSSVEPAASVSVSAWVCIDAAQRYRRIVTKGQALADNYGSYQLITGSLGGDFQDEPLFGLRTTGNGYEVPDPPNGLPFGEWQHVCGVYDGSIAKLFYNGTPVASLPMSGNIVYDSNSLFIGRDAILSEFYNGKIDDIRIYDRALSAKEVEDLYTMERLGGDTTLEIYPSVELLWYAQTGSYYQVQWTTDLITSNWSNLNGLILGDDSPHSIFDSTRYDVHKDYRVVSFDTNLTNGLVAYYPFSGNANDESGNGNHGVVNGATPAMDRFGNSGQAYEFDGVNDYIEVSDSASLKPATSLCVSAWVYIDQPQQYRRILSKRNAQPDHYGSYQLITGSTNINHTFQGEPLFTISTSVSGYEVPDPASGLSVGEWHHLCGVYDGQEAKLFYNGDLVAQKSVNGNIIYDTNPLVIGREVFYDQYYDGKIDDIRIYNRALSAEEVNFLYRRPE